MELASRSARHRFFAACARSWRCERVLLAHHADDQAETILFNLLRGSAGLKGMQFHSEHWVEGKRIQLLRPLIGVTREQIDTFLTNNKISYREDESNAQPVATRNRFRNEVMPLLDTIMGRKVRPALLRAEEISRNREQSIHDLLTELNLEDPQGRLFLPKIQALSTAAQTTALHGYLKKHAIQDIDHSVLDRCRELVNTLPISKVNLPGGRYFRRRAKRLFID